MYNTEQLGVKFYLNGFPKSGLHLLVALVQPFAQAMGEADPHMPWINSHQENAWGVDAYPRHHITYLIGRTPSGRYTKGHLGYDPTFDQFMCWLGLVHIFIYRDLRDVAVSQAHVLWHGAQGPGKSNTDIIHPARADFRKMTDFNEVLSAVIQGSSVYPGVMARWEQYKQWLQKSWVLALKFEDIINDRVWASEQILDYMMERLSSVLLYANPNMDFGTRIELVKKMVASSHETRKSPTFRKGSVGDWKEFFTDVHIKQFGASDIKNELVKLGYEEE